MHDLGTFGGADSVAWAINNHGQIVGSSAMSRDHWLAFLYQDGVMIDLNCLVAPSWFHALESAYLIDDRGDIVASARDCDRKPRIVVLRRTDRAPAADALGQCVSAVGCTAARPGQVWKHR